MDVQEDQQWSLHEPSGDAMGESKGLPVRLLVSPVAGRLVLLPPTRFHQGEEWVSAGQSVARVERGTAVFEIKAPSEARVAGVLARDGEPVTAGQSVVWLDEGSHGPAGGRPAGRG